MLCEPDKIRIDLAKQADRAIAIAEAYDTVVGRLLCGTPDKRH